MPYHNNIMYNRAPVLSLRLTNVWDIILNARAENCEYLPARSSNHPPKRPRRHTNIPAPTLTSAGLPQSENMIYRAIYTFACRARRLFDVTVFFPPLCRTRTIVDGVLSYGKVLWLSLRLVDQLTEYI